MSRDSIGVLCLDPWCIKLRVKPSRPAFLLPTSSAFTIVEDADGPPLCVSVGIVSVEGTVLSSYCCCFIVVLPPTVLESDCWSDIYRFGSGLDAVKRWSNMGLNSC